MLRARWAALTSDSPDKPYYDGRCEVVVHRPFSRRCHYALTGLHESGFAVCARHIDAEVADFTEESARFRFGTTSERILVARTQANWDF